MWEVKRLYMKWKTDLEKHVIVSNFERRGWIRSQNDGLLFCLANKH